MKALITGATGFIGGALARSLDVGTWQTTLLTRPHGRRRLPEGPFAVVEADLADPGQVKQTLAAGTWDVVVHAAAIRNRWGTPPAEYQAVNLAATKSLLDALSGRIKRFVYVSSVGIFGRPGVLGIDEHFPVRVSPDWDYHSTKAASEKLALAHTLDMEVVIVRPTITYGPGDVDGMVTRLMQMVANKHFIRIGDGSNYIHLTYIADLVAGLQLAMTHPAAPGGTFILAGPEPTRMGTLLTLIEECTGVRLPNWYLPYSAAHRAGAICESLFRWLPASFPPPVTRDKVENVGANRGFSWALAAERLGYRPSWAIESGLKQTYNWLSSMNCH